MKMCLIFLLLCVGIFAVETPQYLYKILFPRYWRATQFSQALILPAEDDPFIHFFTEEQLDLGIAQKWTDEKQYAVLKIDASLLNGDFAMSSGEYLYRGYVPFPAIVDVKEVGTCCCANRLPILDLGTPVLRQKAKVLTKEEILSPEIQTLIAEMRSTMKAALGVGLAAPQIGKSIQLAVIEKVDLSRFTPQQLQERHLHEIPFHAIINPKIYFEDDEMIDVFERCLSIPQLTAVVPRAKSVRVECLNERAEPIVIQATGNYALILQHEIDHLDGILYIDRAYSKTISTKENFSKWWKDKSIEEVKLPER